MTKAKKKSPRAQWGQKNTTRICVIVDEGLAAVLAAYRKAGEDPTAALRDAITQGGSVKNSKPALRGKKCAKGGGKIVMTTVVTKGDVKCSRQ